MSVENTSTTLDEVNALLLSLDGIDLNAKGLTSILESGDPVGALANHLRKGPLFPLRWSKPTFHIYEFEEGSSEWPTLAKLQDNELTYQVCADCGTHVWVKVGGLELHLSKRIGDFVQVTFELQVKPVGRGLLVRRPQKQGNLFFCRYACD